jgi:hypothetical protein
LAKRPQLEPSRADNFGTIMLTLLALPVATLFQAHRSWAEEEYLASVFGNTFAIVSLCAGLVFGIEVRRRFKFIDREHLPADIAAHPGRVL